jgi:Domain of unknown function (DUF4371)
VTHTFTYLLVDVQTAHEISYQHFIMLDESTDASVKEQTSFCFRYVTIDLIVNETFVGFYETAATDAGTLFTIATDVLKRFKLSLENC